MKIKNIKITDLIKVLVMALLLFGLSAWTWFRKPDSYSDSERRDLAQFPELSAENILNGKFMKEFEEKYAADQFPMRDGFRGVKSFSELYLLNKLDNNSRYIYNGYLTEIDYPISELHLDGSAEKIRYLCENYLKDTDANVYFSVIPDKNCFLSKESGRLSMDYDKFIETMREKTGNIKYIDITGLLSIDDYYKTDTHWRQERITDIARKLTEEMGNEYKGEFTEKTLDNPFYGVYCGQLALPVKPDTIKYLNSDTLKKCTVKSYANGKEVKAPMYNRNKAYGKDPYEMFLGGADPLIIIENPDADNDRELIIFRDSFGSSLAPLMAESYSKITLVDIRYVASSALGTFIDFKDQDVLFIYSTLVLNKNPFR